MFNILHTLLIGDTTKCQSPKDSNRSARAHTHTTILRLAGFCPG